MHNDKLVHQNVWVSSWVLSISLLGDSLLYVILPVHAEAFGEDVAKGIHGGAQKRDGKMLK